jgi:hypothetical protein
MIERVHPTRSSPDEPCSPEPHAAHYDEHGSCPGVPEHKPPTRVCCGQPHFGAVCPDGLVMCCICFDRFPIAALATEAGQPTDVCQGCMAAERGAV